MTRLSLILLLLCGCAAPVKRVVQTPPLPMAATVAKSATVKESLQVQAAASEEHMDAPDWPKTFWLWWDYGSNASDMIPYLLTEIYSTTNLLQAFAHYTTVPAGTNSVQIMATNQSRFFIARFVLTNNVGLPWAYSDWSRK
jgi:ABC-type molybdate transport system substrate-binding protein